MSLLLKKNLIKVTLKFLMLGIFSLSTGFFVFCTQLGKQLLSEQPNSAQAQEQSRVLEEQIPATNPLELLKLEQVQQELKLTREQIEQLKQTDTEISSELTKIAENRPSILINSQPRTQEEKGREKVAQILTPEQLNRFKQISLQIYGWKLMSKEEVTEILAITPQQEAKLQVFREQNKQKLSNSLREFKSKNPQECRKVVVDNYQKLIQASQESNRQLLSILEKDQIQTLEYMKGEKFTLNFDKIPAICY